MFMISLLSVCCFALLNFESFIHGHFLFFFFFFFFLRGGVVVVVVASFFLGGGRGGRWWGGLVPLNGIKKTLA